MFLTWQDDEDHQTGPLLLEDKEESGESENESEAHQELQSSRKAAWVDEDDELEEA